MGQIFSWVTIEARNCCMQQGIINGTPLTSGDLRFVWDNLQDATYNIRSVAYLTVYNSYQIGTARPSLATSLNHTQALLVRDNGTGEAAQQYGSELIGPLNVLENDNLLSRNK